MPYSKQDAREAIRHVMRECDGVPSTSKYAEHVRDADPTFKTIYNKYDDGARPWLAALLDALWPPAFTDEDEFVRVLVDNFDRDAVKAELEAVGVEWNDAWDQPPESRYEYSDREMRAAMQRAAAAVGEPLTCAEYMEWREQQPVELPHRMRYITRYGSWAAIGEKFDVETGTSRKGTPEGERLQGDVES